MLRNKLATSMALVFGCVLTVHGVVYPQVLESVSFRVSARVSTHPTSYSTAGAVTVPLEMTSPVVADLDCDDILEVIAAGYDGSGASYVYVWNRSGSVRDEWPMSVSGEIDKPPNVGDLDGDGDLEVIVSVGESIYAYNEDGTLVSGYPVSYGYTLGSPVVGDMSGDFGEEVVARQNDRSIALADVDSDGKKEIIVASVDEISITEYDGTVLYSWDIDADSISNVALGDVDSDSAAEIFLGVKDGDINYIYGWEVDGTALSGFPIDTGNARVAGTDSLTLADLDGDNVPEIVTGGIDGWLCAYDFSGDVVFEQRGVEPEDGLLLKYDFNSGNADDMSGNDNNGAVSGATIVDGVRGDALYFNGYSYINSGRHINPTDAVTIEAWIRPTNVTSSVRQYIIRKGVLGWGMFLRRGRLWFYTNTSSDGGGLVSVLCRLPNNRWSHIVGVYDSGSGLMSLYVNGNLIRTIEQTGDININSASFSIGNRYEGYIDEVKIYDRALSQDEILSDMAESEDEIGNIIYQPVIADVDNDNDIEIVAGSSKGYMYCWNTSGDLEDDWPVDTGRNLASGLVLCDIEQDSTGNEPDPAGDLELIYSCADNGRVYVMEMNGNFSASDIQWGMYRYDNRGNGNWLSDVASGWSVFDNEPDEAEIRVVYDWNRGSKVVELDGAGLNNGYAFLDSDGSYLNTKNTQLQWSMRYSLDFAIYVSVDTMNGRRYLYYTPVSGDMLTSVDSSGKYIHHGLGEVKDGKWHTFSRSLVQDLKDTEPDNEIVDINAFYIQGSGRIGDVMFLSGDACGELTNYALDATVSVSSGDGSYVNDGDPDTLWISDSEDNPWVNYSWDEPLEEINKITIENVSGASGVTIFINGVEYEYFEIDSDTIEIVFDSVEDVSSIRIEFTTDGGGVSVGEIGVYYDPNYEDDNLPEEEYTTENYIQIRDGYFWEPTLNEGAGGYWLPHGISYQTWNEALGQWQSPVELRNDLDMMIEAGANAIRVDFVWKHIEEEDDVFSWDNYDMLLEETQARGIKVFAIIGYQWPPDWWGEEHPEWYTMHPQCEAYPDGPWLSDILSYEDPDARAEFGEFLQTVSSRYSIGGAREDLADTVAGWILGNEYGYLGLWSVEYDGYDSDCQNAFRNWLEDRYSGDISALNNRWANDNVSTPGYLPNYPYGSFNEVDMPIPFGYEGETQGQYLARDKASWYDLTEWREESIAGFVAFAANSVRAVDTAHLITYSAVGMQWGEEDWRYHTEDARKIAQACSDADVPLDFWSINNYPWGKENDELMTGKWGIERARHDTGLPVMITETGFTSTETIFTGMDEDRQAVLVRNAIWEALESGAIGVCVFHWNDRNQIGLTERERGFGIVDVDKNPKPAYYSVQEAFQKMDEISMNELLPQFIDPTPDIAFLWDDAVDSIVNRYQAEMHQLYGTLERLGFNPTFINRDELLSGDYLNYRAIVLPRNQKMFNETLELMDDISLSGVKIHVDCDLPGIMDEYGNSRNTNLDWLAMMSDEFGIDAGLSNINIDTNLEDSDYSYGYYETSSFTLDYASRRLYSSILGYDSTIDMWKYYDGIVAGNGAVIATFDSSSGNPALILNDFTGGVEYDTAISLFSLGDSDPSNWTWEDRYNWISLIYTDSDYGFGLTPDLQITGSSLVLVDYRTTSDNSKMLLSFKNYSPDTNETIYVTSSILTGKVIEDLINDEEIENPCDGTVERELEPSGHSLLLAYEEETPYEDEGTKGETDSGTSETGGSTGETVTYETFGTSSSSSSTDTSASGSTSETSSSGSTTSSESAATASEGTASSSSSGTTGSSSTDGGNSEEEESSSYLGPATVVLLNEDTGVTQVGRASSKTTESKGKSSSEKYQSNRSYVGSRNIGEESYVEQKPISEIQEEIPPIDQFAQAIETLETQMPGVIKVEPKKVTREHMEEILKPQSKLPELPIWMEKILEWLNNFIEKIRFNPLWNFMKSRLKTNVLGGR